VGEARYYFFTLTAICKTLRLPTGRSLVGEGAFFIEFSLAGIRLT
jgi:hypothetical protein